MLASGSTVPFVAISVITYDVLRDAYVVRPFVQGKTSDTVPTIIKTIGLGTISGVVATLATYPLDTIRKRFQFGGGADLAYKNSLQCVKQTWNSGGIKGFYAGLVPTLIKIAPAAAVQFSVYDLLKEVSAKTRYF